MPKRIIGTPNTIPTIAVGPGTALESKKIKTPHPAAINPSNISIIDAIFVYMSYDSLSQFPPFMD